MYLFSKYILLITFSFSTTSHIKKIKNDYNQINNKDDDSKSLVLAIKNCKMEEQNFENDMKERENEKNEKRLKLEKIKSLNHEIKDKNKKNVKLNNKTEINKKYDNLIIQEINNSASSVSKDTFRSCFEKKFALSKVNCLKDNVQGFFKKDLVERYNLKKVSVKILKMNDSLTKIDEKKSYFSLPTIQNKTKKISNDSKLEYKKNDKFDKIKLQKKINIFKAKLRANKNENIRGNIKSKCLKNTFKKNVRKNTIKKPENQKMIVQNDILHKTGNYIINLSNSDKCIYDIFQLEIEYFNSLYFSVPTDTCVYEFYLQNQRKNLPSEHKNKLDLIKTYLESDQHHLTYKKLMNILILEKECISFFYQPYLIFIKIISEYDKILLENQNISYFDKILSFSVCLDHILKDLKNKVNSNIEHFLQPLNSSVIEKSGIMENIKKINYFVFSIFFEIRKQRSDKFVVEFFEGLKKNLTTINFYPSSFNIEPFTKKIKQCLYNVRFNTIKDERMHDAFDEIKNFIYNMNLNEGKKQKLNNDTVINKKSCNLVTKIFSNVKNDYEKEHNEKVKLIISKITKIYGENILYYYNEVNLFYCFSFSDNFENLTQNITEKSVENFVNFSFFNQSDTKIVKFDYIQIALCERLLFMVKILYYEFDLLKYSSHEWFKILHFLDNNVAKLVKDEKLQIHMIGDFLSVFKSIQVIQKSFLPFKKTEIKFMDA